MTAFWSSKLVSWPVAIIDEICGESSRKCEILTRADHPVAQASRMPRGERCTAEHLHWIEFSAVLSDGRGFDDRPAWWELHWMISAAGCWVSEHG